MKGTFTVLLIGALVWPSEQSCAPDCAGADAGTFVRDPTDCTRYYVCLNINGELIPSATPLECPDSQYFNDQLTLPRCQEIVSAPPGFCSPLCSPCVADCRLDNTGTVQPHEHNCSNYYVCLNGGHTLLESCPPPTPYFDFHTGTCQTDNFLCYMYCDPCLPHCTYAGQQVPDPNDCTKFFFCTPPTMTSFTCPHGEVFNPHTLKCEAGTPCVLTCPHLTTTTSPTTTTSTATTTSPTNIELTPTPPELGSI